jgi:hypothetical protein
MGSHWLSMVTHFTLILLRALNLKKKLCGVCLIFGSAGLRPYCSWAKRGEFAELKHPDAKLARAPQFRGCPLLQMS